MAVPQQRKMIPVKNSNAIPSVTGAAPIRQQQPQPQPQPQQQSQQQQQQQPQQKIKLIENAALNDPADSYVPAKRKRAQST